MRKSYLKNSSSSHKLAKAIQKIFAEDIKQFPKVEGILDKKMKLT